MTGELGLLYMANSCAKALNQCRSSSSAETLIACYESPEVERATI